MIKIAVNIVNNICRRVVSFVMRIDRKRGYDFGEFIITEYIRTSKYEKDSVIQQAFANFYINILQKIKNDFKN